MDVDRPDQSAPLVTAETETREAVDLGNTPGRIVSIPSSKDSQSGTSDPPSEVVQSSMQQYWISTWLRKRTLIALAALFAAMCISLIILWRANRSQNGFRPTFSSNHYAWTYGPTAILVVVLSLWRQVDYHCKVIQPWQVLRQRPADAAHTLLLDYVASLNVNSFIQAIKYHHHAVSASIAGFTVLKLLVVFSTGLLVLTPTSVVRTYPVVLTTAFDGTALWDMIPPEPFLFSPMRQLSSYKNVSSLPVHAYLGTLNEDLAVPAGTQDGKTFQSFELLHSEEIADEVSTAVDVFNPNITCEIADVTWNTTRGPVLATVQLKTATCSVGSADQTTIDGSGDSCVDSECPDYQIQRFFSKVNCSETAQSSGSDVRFTLDENTPYDNRYAFMVSNMTYEKPKKMNDSYLWPSPGRTAAILCKVDYSIDRGMAIVRGNSLSLAADGLVPGRRLDNFTGLMLGEMIYSSLYETRGLLLDGMTAWDDKMYPDVKTPLFYLLLHALKGKQTLDVLLSAKTLQDSAVRVLEGIAVQFMRSYYMTPARTTTTASGSYTEERLQIATASLWAMVGCTLVLIVLTVFIMCIRPGRIVPQPPDLISTSATILTATPELQQLLHPAGPLRTSQLTALLRNHDFQAHEGERYHVEAISTSESETSDAVYPRKQTAWAPLTARWYMVLLTFVMPLLAIVGLEILYRQSRNHSGIVSVTGNEGRASYLSRYLSALIMLLIATSFNALDFTIASFAPYSLLRSGGMTARRSIRFQILGELPLLALWRSLTHRHFASAFSNAAGLLGSVLTIVASGLWVIDRAVITEHPIQASLGHSWNVTWYNSSSAGDGGAGTKLDQIQHGSAIIPPTLWEDFVLPDVGNIRLAPGSPLHSLDDDQTQNFTLVAGALRPVLSCDAIEDEYLKFSFGQTTSEAELLTIVATPPLAPSCQRGGYNGTNKFYNFTSATQPPGANPLTWQSEIFDLHLGPWNSCDDCASEYTDNGEGYMNLVLMPDNPAGCPSIAFVFAKGLERKTTYDDITVLLCSQRVEQVDLHITYDGKSTSQALINPTIDPFVVNGSSKFLTNGTKGIETFPYRPQTYFGNLTTFNQNGEQQVLDEFTNHLVYGPNGTAFGDLAGKANRPALINAVQNLYAKYMRLVMDAKFRQPITDENDGAEMTVNGSVMRTTSRLQIDYVSKLVLQIILSVITVFGACAYVLADLRGTLPRKPTSIASTMGFLAGSDLCDEQKMRLPKNTEWLRSNELDAVFDGWIFSLGWWVTSSERGVSGDGEDAGSAEQEIHERRSSGDGEDAGSAEQEDGVKRRFGIDVGEPEVSGFKASKWSISLRRKFRSDNK